MNRTRLAFGLLNISIFLLPVASFAQITGGQNVFSFLSLSPSARITGLGGAQIAVLDDDLNFANANPATLNPKMSGRLVFNHNFFLAGIQNGYFAYGKHLSKAKMTVHAGIRYLKYGEIKQADETGLITGKIRAAETAFTLGTGKKLTNRLSAGLNLHLANSTLDIYKASALLADAGLLYADSARRFSAALVVKNKGAQLSTFNGTREKLPYDLQFSLTKRLKHLPFRFGIVAHHLHQWDIRYEDPNAEDDEILLFGEDDGSKKGSPVIDNFFRHLIFNGEFLIGGNESFRIRFGYNHLRKRELSVKNYRSLAGFSGGLGVKINRFRVDFGYASYHLAGGVAHFSIGTNLGDFKR